MTTIPATTTLADLHTPSRTIAHRLRTTLRINAATSLTTGLVAVVAPTAVDGLLDTSAIGWVRVLGLGLCAFAVGVVAVAGARSSRLVRWTPPIVAVDLAWVAGCAGTVAFGWYSPEGAAALAVTGVVVGTFAVRQGRLLRQLRGRELGDETPAIELAAVRTVVRADADTMWEIITDHALYGRLAPNLSAVDAAGDQGPTLTRTCTNRRGEDWHETCILWDEGHRYEMDVDTTRYPYPLTLMRGAWYVQAGADHRTTVGMDFAFRPQPTIGGRAFAVVMQAAFPLVLRHILRGWRREAQRRRPG